MADVPSFFNKADFYAILLPGYLGLLVYLFLFEPAALNLATAQSFDLLSAVIFVVAGPTIGLVIQQTHRIILNLVTTSMTTAQKNQERVDYAELRINASAPELSYIDLMEAAYDFNVSSAAALTILLIGYAALQWNHTQAIVWLLIPVIALLFIAAYFARGDYVFSVESLKKKHHIGTPASIVPAKPGSTQNP